MCRLGVHIVDLTVTAAVSERLTDRVGVYASISVAQFISTLATQDQLVQSIDSALNCRSPHVNPTADSLDGPG